MMLWPFVTVAHHEEVIRLLRERIDVTEQLLAQEYALRAESVREMMAMKRDGFAPPPPLLTPRPEPSALDDAITARAGKNTALRRYLQHFAATQKVAGIKDAAIAESVTNWRSDDDEDGG